MANDFQLHVKTVNATATSDFVPDGTTAINNNAEVVVHALYLTNDSSSTDTNVTVQITDGSGTLKGYIFKSLEVPAGSTVSLEKPINLPQSSVAGTTRKLQIAAGSQKIHGTASVLVIT